MYTRLTGCFLFLIIITSLPLATQNRWHSTAGPVGLSAHPFSALITQKGDILVAAEGGLYRVSSELDTVEVLAFPGLDSPDMIIGRILESPRGHLFALMYTSDCSYSGGEVFRSTDGGTSWHSVLCDIMDTMMFAPSGRIYGILERDGLTHSDDGGESWRSYEDSLGSRIEKICLLSDGTMLVVHEENGLNYYDPQSRASRPVVTPSPIWDVSRRADGAIIADGDTALISMDEGRTWNRFDVYPEEEEESPDEIIEVLARDGSGRVVVGIREIDEDGNESPSRLGIGSGSTITAQRDYLGFAQTHMLATMPDGRIFDGTEHGLYARLDRDDTWHDIGNDWIVQKWTAPLLLGEGILLAGADDGIYLSRNEGKDWNRMGLEKIHVDRIRIDSLYGIIAIGYGDAYQSKDGTEWWPLFSYLERHSITDVLNLGNGIVLVATDDGLFRSLDRGETWALDSTLQFDAGDDRTLLLERARNGRILAAIGSSFYSSGDDGYTWRVSKFCSEDDVLPYALEEEETPAPDDTNEVIVRRVVSPNHDEYEEIVPAGIAEGPNGQIAVASNVGLFRSFDGGRTWEQVLIPGPTQEIASVTFDARGALVVGPRYGPVYIEQIEAPAVVEAPVRMAVAVNAAPNPANETTTITFTLGERDRVTLDVFDTYGARVAELASGTLQPGIHSFRFPQSNSSVAMASGVYTVRLVTSAGFSTRRIVMMR